MLPVSFQLIEDLEIRLINRKCKKKLFYKFIYKSLLRNKNFILKKISIVWFE